MCLRTLRDVVYSAVLSVLIAGAPGAGLASPGLSEQEYFEELPVVLSVSRLAQPLNEAPGAVTVIDRDMIRQSGARQIIDLLRLVPGFQVASAPVSRAMPSAVYHGIAENYPRHMQVLLDGRSQYSPFYVGGVNWNLIPVSLDDIDRIEVVRGSNSAAYGSNAVLGVVNIITRHAAETQGVAAEVRAGNGSINDKHVRVGSGGRDFSFRYTAEARFDNGFANFDDNTTQRLKDFRADWRLGLRDEVQMQAGEIVTAFQTGAGDTLDPVREQKQRQQFMQVGWRHTTESGEDIAVRYYRSEEGATDLYTTSGAVPVRTPVPHVSIFTLPVDYSFRSVRNNLEAVHTFNPSPTTRLIWGGEVRTDSVRTPLYYGRTDEVSMAVGRLFGNLEWRPMSDWIANFGGTWEHDTNSKTTFAPRIAVNWHALPGQTFRAGVTRAYRTPSLLETRGNWAWWGKSALDGWQAIDRKLLVRNSVKPEVLTSRELGWLGEFKPLRLTGDVRVFSELLADRLVKMDTYLSAPNCELWTRLPCGQAGDMFNAQNVRIRGIEYQFRWQPHETTRLLLNQSFIRIDTDFLLPMWTVGALTLPPAGIVAGSDYRTDVTQTNNSAPTHATTAMLMQRLPGGFDLSATYHVVGAMMWSTGIFASGWRRLDWRLGYPFRFGSTRGELAFTVQSDGAPHIERGDNKDDPRMREFVPKRGFVSLRLEY